jgi:hypothetical protein
MNASTSVMQKEMKRERGKLPLESKLETTSVSFDIWVYAGALIH